MTMIRSARAFTICLALAIAVAVTPASSSGQSLSDQAHSLRLVPADAAFYSANLRMEEQWKNFSASRAYARLMLIPVVQSAKLYLEYQFQESPEPSVAIVREYFASDEGKDAIALVKEMLADEVFAYGGADVGDLFAKLLELNSIRQQASFQALATQQDPNQVSEQLLFEWLEKNKDQLVLPDGVMGFRVRDRARAERFLGLLEQRLQQFLTSKSPELAGRVQRETVNGTSFVTLRLDGSLLPWDSIQADAPESSAEEIAKWKGYISGKTMVVALGVVDEFLVVSMGDSTDHMRKLGQGATLADSPSLHRLAKHAGQRLTAISLASGEFVRKVNSPERSLNDAAQAFTSVLEQTPLTTEQRAKLTQHIHDLTAAIINYLPQPGGVSGVSMLTSRGYEIFRYNEGTIPSLDASQPLNVLNHVGGNPLFLFATHAKDSVDDYDLAVGWVKKLAVDLEQIAEQHTPPQNWAQYLKYRDRVLALLQRLDRANRELIIPSMKSNEQALVLDAASKSERWFAPMTRSPQPLPMFEFGLVSRVNDAELLKKGVAEYFAVINEALALAHEIHPADVPEIQLPLPQMRSTTAATIYSYPFPAEWGVDSQITPNAGLTNDTAVVSLMPAFTEQLLKPVTPAIDTAIDLNRPAGVVMHFQFSKLIDVIRPWIDYGVGVATGGIPADGVEPDPEVQQAMLLQLGLIMPQVNQMLDFLSAFRSQTSITFREDDVWVTHAEIHFQDLE